MSSPPDSWPHFYQQNPSNEEPLYGEQGYGTTTTAVTTTVTSSTATSTALGRIGKPARKRSRASRRTPTTLLNTDPANFRAMVQQFTGGPSAPFAPGSAHPGGPNLGFGLGQPRANPGSFTVHPAGFQLQYQYQQQQQQQLQQQHQFMQQQNQAYMFSLNGNDDDGARDQLIHRPNMEVGSEGNGADGVSSQVAPPRTTSSNENTSNNYSFMF